MVPALESHTPISAEGGIGDITFYIMTTKIKIDTFYLKEPFPELHQHKEELFKLKLKLFEEDVVKNSKAKEKKTTLRKAENFVEVISAYHAFVK